MFVVKVPGVDCSGKTDGCKNSGDALIKELRNIQVNEQGKLVDVGLLDLEEIHLDNSNLKYSKDLIFKNSFKAFETKPKTIYLGGDHFISYSINKAFIDYCGKNEKEACLIIFDAHPNCVDSKEKEFPKNEEWLRSLVDEGYEKKDILLVGVRNFSVEEIHFLKKNNIRFILMNSFIDNLHEICDIIMEFSNKKESYISIDMSIIDPSFAPSTNYAEPGGLTSREFIYLIQRLNKIKNLRAIDIVGIDSENDKNHDNATVKLGSKILSELV